MKNTKVRAQQIIMTVGCMGFLVWVGLRGMNERKGKQAVTTTTETQAVALASEGVHLQEITEEIIAVQQTYPTQLVALPPVAIRSNQAGELVQLKVDVNSRIEVGQEIALIRVAQGDTIGLGKVTRMAREAKQHVKDELDLLLAIDRGEDGSEAKEKYEKQYTRYSEAKRELTQREEQVNQFRTPSRLTYVEKRLQANRSGVVKQVLVGAGREIEVNQALVTVQSSGAKSLQLEASSEYYLLLRNHLNQTTAELVFQDGSTYSIPAAVIATLNQKSISEEGKIVLTLDLSSIPNLEQVRKITWRIQGVSAKVVQEKALFQRDNTAYIWTVNEEQIIEATPVVVVKKEGGKAYLQQGKSTWTRVLVGDLSTVKEGEAFDKTK